MDRISNMGEAKTVTMKNRRTGEIKKLKLKLCKTSRDSLDTTENESNTDDVYSVDDMMFLDDDGRIIQAQLIALHPSEDRPFELKVQGEHISLHVTYTWIEEHLLRKFNDGDKLWDLE